MLCRRIFCYEGYQYEKYLERAKLWEWFVVILNLTASDKENCFKKLVTQIIRKSIFWTMLIIINRMI